MNIVKRICIQIYQCTLVSKEKVRFKNSQTKIRGRKYG